MRSNEGQELVGVHIWEPLSDIMRNIIPICHKRKVFNQCVLPAMMYGSETWAVTKKIKQKLKIYSAQYGVHHARNI